MIIKIKQKLTHVLTLSKRLNFICSISDVINSEYLNIDRLYLD